MFVNTYENYQLILFDNIHYDIIEDYDDYMFLYEWLKIDYL